MNKLLPALLFLLPATLLAQKEPSYDMGKMQMIFLRLSPGWSATDRTAQVINEHRAHVTDLVKKGVIALHGEVTGDEALREIMVFKIDSMEKAVAIVESMPGVEEGMLAIDGESWFAARNLITPPAEPITPSHYIFGLLVRGSSQERDTATLKKLQEGHMANIKRLADMGKLVLAGPFFAGGERRGVFIFKVDSIEEARALTETDPAVIAGRLKFHLYHWTVPTGTLP